MKQITLKHNGQVEWLCDNPPIDIDISHVTRRRVSHIVPAHRGKRFAFRLLRAIFGERGRVAEWTRTDRWGPWRVTVIKTKRTAIYGSRLAALDWEQRELEQ